MGCSARAPRTFPAAAAEQAQRALAAWQEAVSRAASLGPSRLLYEARISQGLARTSGTLAVRIGAGEVEANLSGPFGSPLARYEKGALVGEGIRAIPIGGDELRSLLAGVWTAGVPTVAGAREDQALLVWDGTPRVEEVLDLAQARGSTLRVSRADGTILATYSGTADPWPSRIEISELRSGSKLRLALLAREPL